MKKIIFVTVLILFCCNHYLNSFAYGENLKIRVKFDNQIEQRVNNKFQKIGMSPIAGVKVSVYHKDSVIPIAENALTDEQGEIVVSYDPMALPKDSEGKLEIYIKVDFTSTEIANYYPCGVLFNCIYISGVQALDPLISNEFEIKESPKGPGVFDNVFYIIAHIDYLIRREYFFVLRESGYFRDKVFVTIDPASQPAPAYDPVLDKMFLPGVIYNNRIDSTTPIHEYAHALHASLLSFSLSSLPVRIALRLELLKIPNSSLLVPWDRSTPKIAFYEGFGPFMEPLIMGDKNRMSESSQPSTEGNIENNMWWTAISPYDPNPKLLTNLKQSGEIVEGAIESILWDIYDDANISQSTMDDDELSEGFQGVWYPLFSAKATTFKEFWNSFMSLYSSQSKRQSFRKISEQNGIVYSRAKLDYMLQLKGFLGLDLPSLTIFTRDDMAEIVDDKPYLFANDVSKDNLHVQETESIKNVTLKYRKRPSSDPNTIPPEPDNLLPLLWDDVPYQWATATLVSAPVQTSFGIAAQWDVGYDVKDKNAEGVYDLLIQAQDENDTYDSFYPNLDLSTSSSLNTQQWLRDLGTLTTVHIKPPHMVATTPLDGSVGIPVTQQIVLADFHKPMDGTSFRVARAPSSFMFAMADSRTLTDASAFLDTPSILVKEKCTGRRIRVLEAKYIEDKPTKKFEMELKVHDDEAGPQDGEKHLKDNTLYEVTLVSQELKDIHGLHLDGNADGVVQAEGDDYSFSFYTGNIVPYLQAVELRQDEIKVCDKDPLPVKDKLRYKAHWELACDAQGNVKNELKLDVDNQTVGRAPLKIKLTFPKPMNTEKLEAYLDFHGDGFDDPTDTTIIAPVQGAGATRINTSASPGMWTQNNHIWTGSFEIPAHDPNFEDAWNNKTTRLVVYAEDADGNKLDSDPSTLNFLPDTNSSDPALQNPPAPEQETYTVVNNPNTTPYETKDLTPIDKHHRFSTQIVPQLARLVIRQNGTFNEYTGEPLCSIQSGELPLKDVEVTSPLTFAFSEHLFKIPNANKDRFYAALPNQFTIEEWGAVKTNDMTEEEIKNVCDTDITHPERKGQWDRQKSLCTGWIKVTYLAPALLWKVNESGRAEDNGATVVSLDYSAYAGLESIPRLLRYNRDYRVTIKAPTQNVDGTYGDDGVKDLNGFSLDGDLDEEADGKDENTYRFVFSTQKPKVVLSASPLENKPPSGFGFNRFLAYWIYGADLCKFATPKHDVHIKNLNVREEKISTGMDSKNLSPVDPKSKATLCDWSQQLCPTGDPDDSFVPFLSQESALWGKLKIFPWDACGELDNTLTPSVVETRVEKTEPGGCLLQEEFSDTCKLYGELLPIDDMTVLAKDIYPENMTHRTPGPAGDGKPDESVSVASTVNAVSWNTGDADVFVGANGFYKDTGALLERFSVKKFPMDIESIGQELLKYRKVVVLPSASLSGYDTSELIKTQFAEFVRNGGILVAFTQQRGFDYTVLPGGEVSAAGYLEDISCLTAGSIIDQYHPIMAGQKDSIFDGGIDGYFLTWPENAKILLRRKKNNFPALIVYPYGQGFVVASTLYTDYAGSTGQLTADETQLLKDLMVWLKNPKTDYTEAKPGETLTLNLLLQNGTPNDANAVKLTVTDNAGQTAKEETVSVSVPAGQTVPYAYSFMPPSTLGNYRVDYMLLFDTQTVQAQTPADSFSVTEHLQSATPSADVLFSVTAPGSLFPKDAPITFTIRIQNNSDVGQTLHLSYWSHVHSGDIDTVTVPAHSEVSVPYTTPFVYFYDPNVLHAWRWDFSLKAIDAQGHNLTPSGTADLDGQVYVPLVSATLAFNKKSYASSQTGNALFYLFNPSGGSFTTEMTMTFFNPVNQKILTLTQPVDFPSSQQKIVPFTLPDALLPGVYTVEAAFTIYGREIGRTTAYFTVEKAKLTVTPVLSSIILKAEQDNVVGFTLKNTGLLAISSGNFNAVLIDPDGLTVAQDTKSFTLNIAEEKTVYATFHLPPLKFGDYRLKYTASTETGSITGQSILPSSTVMNLSFDKPSYKLRDTLNATLFLTNTGKFEQTINVEGKAVTLNFTQTDSVVLLPGETKQVSYHPVIPDTTLLGLHPFSVTLTMGNVRQQSWNFTLPPSKLMFHLSQTDYTEGQSGQISAANVGGGDTSYTYELKLYDVNNVLLKTETGQGDIAAGEQKQISFTLPASNLVTGTYRLSVVATDTVLNKKVPFDAYLQITGVSASVSTVTDKKVYKKGDTVNVSTTVTPQGNLQNAALTTTIYKKENSYVNFSQLGSTAAVVPDGNVVWYGTAYRGAFKYDKVSRSLTNIIPNTYVYAIAADTDNVYFATKSGVVRMNKQTGAQKTYTVPDATCLVSDGSFLWIGSWMGLYRLEKLNEVLTHWSTLDGMTDNRLTALALDGNFLWLGTYDHGVMKYDKLNNTFEAVNTGAGQGSQYVKVISADEEAVYIGTLGGLEKYDKGTTAVTTYTTAEGLANNWVYALAHEGNTLWIGTWEGLSKLDTQSNTFENLTTVDGLASNYVRAVAVDKDNVYFGFFTH